MSVHSEKYVFPFITWQQYNDLIQSDNRLKASNFAEWERRYKDAEYRLLYGCVVCGFKGILTKTKIKMNDKKQVKSMTKKP